MAKIHSFGPRLEPEGMRRLNADLNARMAQGDELNARAPHIRSLGLSLERMVKELRSRVAGLDAANEVDGMNPFLEQLDTLVRAAKSYADPT